MNLLYPLFLALLIVGCSSGQGHLEASNEPILAEGWEVDEVPGKQSPAKPGLASEDLPTFGDVTEEGAAAMETPDAGSVLGDTTAALEEELADTTPSETDSELGESSPASDEGPGDPGLAQARRHTEAWEEDGVREEFGEDYTRVVFSEILGEDGYTCSFLDDPPRLVLDVKQPNREVLFTRLPLKGAAFERIRVGRHPEKTRFVLDLREEGQPEPVVQATDTDLVVLVGTIAEQDDPSETKGVYEDRPEPEAQRVEAVETAVAVDGPGGMEPYDPEPIPMGGPEVPLTVAEEEWKPVRVKGVEFEPGESASEVVIRTDTAAAPYDVQEEDDSIVLTLPGAQIPENLLRPLDTKAFPSAILAVTPEQVGTGPTGKAVFRIQLREKTPFNVLEQESGIRVSVLLPETPPEIPLLPPPALPETEGLAKAGPESAAEPPPVAEAQPSAEAEASAEPKATGEPEAAKKEEEAKTPEMPSAPPEPVVKPAGKPPAQPPQKKFLAKNYKGKKISLDFKDADIQNVLRLIAEVSGKNIVISDAVKGKVTIRLLNVPWDMALDVILKTYALEKEQIGPNILRVAPYTQLKQEREEALRAEEALQRVETMQTRVVPVNYAKAKDLEPLLARLKSKRPDASILVDSRTNALVLRDLPTHISGMVELVRSLDTQTPQVLIEAKIVELDINFERELGIQWGALYKAGPVTGNPTGLNFPNTASVGGVVENITGQTVPGIANPVVNLPAAVDETAGGALGFSLASLTNSFQLDAQLSALEKRNHARVLSSPRVATLSNQEARINQGQEVPYQTTSDEGTKTEFKEAVLQLSVTPQITFDRSIIMNILVTNDTPIRDPTVGFIIGTKEAKTTVLVKDGDTAVIGGIFTNNDAETLGGVPYLMDLPVAGSLFKKKGESNKRTELVIFITPRIIPSELITVDQWAGQEEQEEKK